jgi:hypothetical protein
MDRFVTLSHRNVCKEGFGLKDAVDAGELFMKSVMVVQSLTPETCASLPGSPCSLGCCRSCKGCLEGSCRHSTF